MKRIIILMAVLLCVFASAAYAATLYGTDENQWGPLSEHPNFPLPNDCMTAPHPDRQGDIFTGTLNADTMYGQRGCDYIRGRDGADVMHGNADMDTIYGGLGADREYGDGMHDHLFGEEGNDYLDARDGMNEPGNHEETRCGPGDDKAWLESDPDGVEFSDCETLNGATPIIKGAGGEWNNYSQSYVDTSDQNDQFRQNVNDYLNAHGG